MIVKLTEDTKGIVSFVSVTAEQLEWHSNKGWFLVAMMEETAIDYVTEQLPQSGGYNPTNIKKPLTLQVTRYLLGRKEESAVADLNAQVEQYRANEGTRAEALRKAKEQAADLERKLAGERGRKEEILALLQNRDTAMRVLNERNHKYEVDLGKVRQALGDLRMKEILG